MPMDNNKLIARFQELSLFDDEKLFSLWKEVTGEVSDNRHQVIRDIAVNENVTWKVAFNPAAAAKADGLKELMTLFPKIFQSKFNYTQVSWKRDIDRVFDFPDDELVFFKRPDKLNEDMLTFSKWFFELLGPESGREREQQIASRALTKFRDIMFFVIDKSLVDKFNMNIAMDALSAMGNDKSSSLRHDQQVVVNSGYCEAVRRYIVAVNAEDPHDPENDEHVEKMMDLVGPMLSVREEPAPTPLADALAPDDVPGMPDLNTHLGGLPTDDVPGSGECFLPAGDIPGMPMLNAQNAAAQEMNPNEVVLDVEEAVIQTAPDEVVPDTDAHLSVKVIRPTADAPSSISRSKYRDMIGTYTEMPINKITTSSWRKCRKEHNLEGRCSVFIKKNPGTPKQNKCFKYKTGHVCDANYEGVLPGQMGPLSLHPYGEVIIVCD